MTDRPPPGAVENYTRPFLVTAGAIVFMSLWTICALAGFLWVLICAFIADRAISLLPRR